MIFINICEIYGRIFLIKCSAMIKYRYICVKVFQIKITFHSIWKIMGFIVNLIHFLNHVQSRQPNGCVIKVGSDAYMF